MTPSFRGAPAAVVRARRPALTSPLVLGAAAFLGSGLLGSGLVSPAFGPGPPWAPGGSVPFGPASLSAQSIVRADVEGVVRATDGRPLAGAFITATEVRSGAEVTAETDRNGSFRIPLLRSGEFQIRIESMGYVPQLIQGVRVPPGQVMRLPVELVSAPPPVDTVDTVFVGGGAHTRYGGETGRRVTRGEVASFPDRRMGLGGLAALNPLLDESLGSEGLPGVMTQVAVDGIPFTPAQHPLQRGGAGDLPFLPRISLDQMEIHRGTDVEWSGAAGSFVSVMSRSSGRERGVELFGAGSTNAFWFAGPFSGRTEPEMRSGWGGGALHLPLGGGASHLFVGVEGMLARTPQPSPFSAEMADRIATSWPGGEGADAGELSEPWLGRLQTFSGLTRLDWQVSEKAEVMARVGFAALRDGGGRLFARPLEYGVTAPSEGSDLSAAASVMVDAHPMVDLEIRAGFERSLRDWGDTEGGPAPAPVPATRFVGPGVVLGPDPGLAGRITRTGFQGGGTAHVRLADHQLKGGVAVSIPSFEYEHVYRSDGEFLFSEPEGMASGEGVFLAASGAGGPRNFTMPEVGVFVQHRWEPIDGIRITSGIRFDRESLADGEVPLNQRWAELTGIGNTGFRAALDKVSTRLGLEWDLSGDGQTMLEAGLASHYGRFDPAAMNEVIVLSGSARTTRQLGGLGAWPGPPGIGEERSALTLFGPGVASPRTARAALGFSQRLGEGTVIHLSGTFRQTRQLLRRSDLNLTLGSLGNLEDGRPVYGELTQIGSAVVAEPGTNRRFSEFDHVWALNFDGRSDYTGITAAVEHELGPSLDFFASYTYSETEDNLVGARSGTPEARVRPGLGEARSRWDEGRSDFDVPHRGTVGFRGRLAVVEGMEVTGVYRFRSGLPFTPGYRPGVDVNGDGSWHNDPAFVAEGGSGRLACLNADVGGIARRNACRGESASFLDLHLALGIFRVGPSVASLTLDLFNVLDAELGRPDTALWLVDPDGSIETAPESGDIILPLIPNPEFGTVTNPYRTGRMLRVGFKVMLP